MNATQWQELGYKTILRDENIFLYRPMSGIVIRTRIDNGKWMEYDNLNDFPWIKGSETVSDDTMEKLAIIADHCYCGQVRLCDFCSGLRRVAEELPKTLTEAIDSGLKNPTRENSNKIIKEAMKEIKL